MVLHRSVDIVTLDNGGLGWFELFMIWFLRRRAVASGDGFGGAEFLLRWDDDNDTVP